MIISEDPRLCALEVGVTGSYTKDVNDFWRPLYSKEAFVDGQHSVQCYLDAITGAYGEWKKLDAETQPDATAVTRRLYHVPYGKMAKKAHRQVMAIEGKTDAEADQSYATEVASSLELPGQVGNVYTGSLYLAFASLMNSEASTLEGGRISFFSYGSGCTAEFFAGTIVPGAGAFAKALEIDAPLKKRRRFTIAEYEAIRRADNDADRRPVEAGNYKSAVAFTGVDKDIRQYQG